MSTTDKQETTVAKTSQEKAGPEKSSTDKSTSDKPNADKVKSHNNETKHTKKNTRTKSGSISAFLVFNLIILIAIIGATGFFGYKGWQKLAQQESLIQSQQQQLDKVLNAQAQVSQDVQNQLKNDTLIQNKELTTIKETIAAFLKQNQHTRRDWLIAEAEYLIKLANHRLILSHDIETGIQALQAADSRLLEVGNPKFIPLRKALAVDIEKLNAVPQLDIVGISLKLNALQQQVETLPLVTPDPKTIEQRNKAGTNRSKVDSWQQLPGAIWKDLLKLVHIQQHNEAIKPLLLPEQHFFLVQNLKLQLEQARLALLNNHPVIYKDRIEQAIVWINLYFDKQQPLTQAVNTALKKLANTNITLTLPDIANSLTNLQLLQPNNTRLLKRKSIPQKSLKKKKTISKYKKQSNKVKEKSTPNKEIKKILLKQPASTPKPKAEILIKENNTPAQTSVTNTQ